MQNLYDIYDVYSSPTGTVDPIETTSELLTCYTDTSQQWSQTLGLLVLSRVPIELVEVESPDETFSGFARIYRVQCPFLEQYVSCLHTLDANQ